MSTSELVGATFNELAQFIASLQPMQLGKQRDGATRKFVHWCTKLKMPINPGDAIPTTLTEVEQRAAIRGTYIAMPVELCQRLPETALQTIDQLLAAELKDATVVDSSSLPLVAPNISIWQGDMSKLKADAVVNPANGMLLGCFLPTHKCLDNILHAQAGPQLRIACEEMKRSHNIDDDANGMCRVTSGYALPAAYVFHTVGPCLVEYTRRGDPLPPRAPTKLDQQELSSCYIQCLETAQAMGLSSVAFCCISTGVFGYPSDAAAKLAMEVTRDWMKSADGEVPHVIFNVFLDKDFDCYQKTVPLVFGGEASATDE